MDNNRNTTNLSRRSWAKQAASLAGAVLVGQNVLSLAMPSARQGTDRRSSNAAAKVIIGLQTYSLRDRSLPAAITAMRELGIRHCELWEGHVEPEEYRWQRGLSLQRLRENRERLRQWRAALSMEVIAAIREQFDDAGIHILAYNATFKDDISDQELGLAFRIAKELGTDTINSSATVRVMERVDAVARQYQIRVGIHNHANVKNPNEFATPDSFARGMAGKSDLVGINLDTGHFTAANFDPLQYIHDHHDRIFSIHLKDRKANQGPRTPFGEGDTPLADILTLLKTHRWNIPAFIEYEYDGADTMAELRRCIAYCREALDA